MLADDMRRLAEEISNAYEERVGRIAEIKQKTEKELARFRSDLDASEADRKHTTQADLKKTAKKLRADLDKFKADLDASETDRKSTTQTDLKKTADQLRADLDKFKADLDASEADRKHTTQADLKKTADQLRADLDKFKADLDASETDRKSTTQTDLKKTADQLRADLDKFKADLDASEADRKHTTQADLKKTAEKLSYTLLAFSEDLSAGVAGLMGEFKKDRSEAANAWNKILSTMLRSAGGETALTYPAKVKAEVGVKTVSETIKKENGLRSKILGILGDNSNGLRMVEIADTLGIENWRSLIPLMTRLKDSGEVRKEDSSYYAA